MRAYRWQILALVLVLALYVAMFLAVETVEMSREIFFVAVSHR